MSTVIEQRAAGPTDAPSADDVARAAVDRAREAQRAWGALSHRERARKLRALRGVVVRRLDEIVGVITAETG